jgi:hypothetical protein
MSDLILELTFVIELLMAVSKMSEMTVLIPSPQTYDDSVVGKMFDY